jgi:hypothetical protein
VPIREIAAPSARDQNLARGFTIAFQNDHPPAPASGFDRAHETGCPAAQDYCIAIGLRHLLE